MAATASIDTPERSGEMIYLPLAAATKIFAGTLVAVNSAGNALPAADTAGLRVMGRAEQTVDNTGGAAGDLSINVKRGVFRLPNSATAAVDADDKGKICFIETDEVVAETSTHKVKAGRVVDVDDDGVWVDTREAHDVPSADTLTALTFSATVTQAEGQALRNAVLALFQAQNLVK